jgi:Domain of unknown function (DUF397)
VELSCIEWRKASYSTSATQNCVEAGAVGRALAVRDSKDPGGPVLAVAPHAWRAFTERVKAGAPGPA